MNIKKYQAGGIGPKKKAAKAQTSTAYEKRREESRAQQESNADLVRRQMKINQANKMMANPSAYETALGRAGSPAYKTVSGQMQGISSAERAGASKGTVGSMTPEAAKRSEAAMKKPATTLLLRHKLLLFAKLENLALLPRLLSKLERLKVLLSERRLVSTQWKKLASEG